MPAFSLLNGLARGRFRGTPLIHFPNSHAIRTRVSHVESRQARYLNLVKRFAKKMQHSAAVATIYDIYLLATCRQRVDVDVSVLLNMSNGVVKPIW